MIIVTRNQYIAAQKIHHITLDEEIETVSLHSGKDLLQRRFAITVVYTPEAHAQNTPREDNRECTVLLRSRKDAYTLFKDMCNQIREQSPDALYLNKILENFLSEADLEKIGASDDEETMEKEMEESLYDPNAKKVRRTGKTKRKNKKLLRRIKNSRRGRGKRNRR